MEMRLVRQGALRGGARIACPEPNAEGSGDEWTTKKKRGGAWCRSVAPGCADAG
ncbi:hypothetical protein [Streptomyces litchfieldiae]|uniref:Uncharacterized protein n=1 Tax=Streptomyces litchfieldiae TaxID=3075543 RepID=A0ABU2MLF8_9ACTN|nr:hypothetical protein [Streptomyces sp. DSM 44938]MDT0342441.1 hypothetical protein [Streptomyces sp. DSM 44938]